jgi:polyhydroxyalkanoate synthesis regulator protein
LIQLLAQEENGKSPLFTTEILKSLICFYGNPLQKAMSQFLEKGLLLFADPKANFEDYLQHVIKNDESLNKVATEARQGIDMWGTILAKFLENPPAENAVDNRKTQPTPK